MALTVKDRLYSTQKQVIMTMKLTPYKIYMGILKKPDHILQPFTNNPHYYLPDARYAKCEILIGLEIIDCTRYQAISSFHMCILIRGC